MFPTGVRTTLELRYNDEVRDLRVTYDLMDRVGRHVRWEEIAADFEGEKPIPNFLKIAKFVFLNFREAGFDPDFDVIYNEMMVTDENKAAYIALAGELIAAYMPQGSKKKPEVAKSQKKASKK